MIDPSYFMAVPISLQLLFAQPKNMTCFQVSKNSYNKPCSISQEIKSKTKYLVLLLTGKAHEWATAVWMNEGDTVHTHVLIVELFHNMFPKGG